ncbi:MAG: hypothetical protein H0U61_00940 [Nocardioidaceae bacterium]|nr:hypothetical protein [Nocardioidaceae bacterium]
MRMMLKAQLDTPTATKGIQDGSLPSQLQSVLETLKPEAAYFGPGGGARTCYLVFDMADPSQLPKISEPFFALNANVEIFPVMDQTDLQKGLSSLTG